jgi:hypothetical protein
MVFQRFEIDDSVCFGSYEVTALVQRRGLPLRQLAGQLGTPNGVRILDRLLSERRCREEEEVAQGVRILPNSFSPLPLLYSPVGTSTEVERILAMPQPTHVKLARKLPANGEQIFGADLAYSMP